MSVSLTPGLREEYGKLFDCCQVTSGRQSESARLAAQIVNSQARYQTVSSATGVPWQMVAVLHAMEASLRFDRHLHNGDPLTARTVHVPAGLPKEGEPPFTWEASAVDALRQKGLDDVTDWSLPSLLYHVEKYNGMGYRLQHPEVLTPYLWSGSSNYSSGKFVADHKFDPTAVSKQIGAAVLLKLLPPLSPSGTSV